MGWLDGYRATAAGIVWTIIAYATGMEAPQGMPGLWLYLFIWPIGYFVFLPIAIVAGWLRNVGVPFAGLITFLPAIMVIPGDPIVYFLHKANKNLVPVESYRFIEPAFCIWVYESMLPPMKSDMAPISQEGIPSQTSSCPFPGKVLIEKNTRNYAYRQNIHWKALSIL